MYSYKQNLRWWKPALSETLTASLLLTCIVCFFIVNIRNILTTRRISEKTAKPHAEIEMPSGFVVNLAAFATFMYFIEAFAYVILTLTARIFWTDLISIRSFGQLAVVTQIMGSALTTNGYFIFIWSVLARGRHATSWEMRDDHRLVTWGPYKHIRHPSYLGYFLMFLGLFIIWPSIITVIPLAATPGYVLVPIKKKDFWKKDSATNTKSTRRRQEGSCRNSDRLLHANHLKQS